MVVGLVLSIHTTAAHDGYGQSPVHLLQWRVTILRVAWVITLHQLQHLVKIKLARIRTNALPYPLLHKLMFHVLIDEGSKNMPTGIVVGVERGRTLYGVGVCTARALQRLLKVYVREHHRLKVGSQLRHKLLVELRTVAYLHSLELTNLKEYGFQFACPFRIPIHLDTIGIASFLVYIHLHIAATAIH